MEELTAGFALGIITAVGPEWRNGRRRGFKIRCPQKRAGSSPAFGTFFIGFGVPERFSPSSAGEGLMLILRLFRKMIAKARKEW